MEEFKIKVDGIPAIAVVTSYKHVKGQGLYSAVSDLDYYGYTEMEFLLKDRKGYPKEGEAQWLVNKAEDGDLWGDIEAQINEQIGEREADYDDCY